MTAAGKTAAGHTMLGTDPATYQPMVLGQEAREVGGALVSMKDFYNMHGNPIPGTNEDPEVIRRKQPIRKVARKTNSTTRTRAISKTRATTNARIRRCWKTNTKTEIVKQVMKERGLSLIDASKYVKTNNVYSRD